MSKSIETPRQIASNKKARHDYAIETQFEAGLVLEGWEIKSIRDGHVQLKESYVILKRGEAWLIGAHIMPLKTASTHIEPDPTRSRKLLLNRRELSKLFIAKDRQGYTIVPLDLHWSKNRAKIQIAIAKGKKQHDKRATIKEREWNREKQRVLRR
ncbi:MAG: SsrA-binding protein [Gammaproteobacteria bacterium RIFCSPLOWO2_02_FULL_42_14]|nr:MAG: SsrA-binding protein [Gammaproteobacteria bacterium RIFCSPHIGHO2_02_FULL_42_43]OGT28076.1 MAG: SsrA-binding protein [Gammaproteobacteria bacterium RIFCSPHIGHO2_01_FULL_42_8]OGT52560.1 MAG: SsrA-binding protein [Gammaproteobacteria bacterium RIFCSPHIGHO2_12_FULL_41_25]OGT63158.1 MAG: SsrA-binding protein [Gammaproteobacteria bacterium RIFCSPLOWO2_02_FULL_42_14]OGT86658.1 MAG: SsrA-binding protein [Gammaproteobacteria bacterium RIFCSPLOWO2_12_FULL_42_18]